MGLFDKLETGTAEPADFIGHGVRLWWSRFRKSLRDDWRYATEVTYGVCRHVDYRWRIYPLRFGVPKVICSGCGRVASMRAIQGAINDPRYHPRPEWTLPGADGPIYCMGADLLSDEERQEYLSRWRVTNYHETPTTTTI